MKITYKDFLTKALIAGALLSTSSCKKFVEIGAPPTQILFEEAFKSDASAQSTVLGLYSSGTSAPGVIGFYSFLAGISADDLQYNSTDALYQEFATNAVTNTNGYAANAWASSFGFIKNANNIISGLTTSTSLTPALKNQLLGEAKFMRAFAYFYLVNLYGEVPMPMKDDYSAFENAALPRSPVAAIYAQVLTDLTEAQTLLPVTYTGTFRGRINKYAATSLLARVYLYQKNYAGAEAQASEVISSNVYSLPAPATAFINTSNEVIWQIANINGFTTFGTNYVTSATVIPTYSLNDDTYKSFEAVDLRKTNWTALKTIGGKTYNTITKYKVASGTGNEYSVALRFAELYLIRAEARAQQNNLTAAKSDLNMIRVRAGLPAISTDLLQPQLLTAIEQERRVEFFGEWGHRWLDLKRTNRVDAVMSAARPTTWKPTSALFPVPQSQILINASLTQNPGY
ncbi:MAG: RagB/SusD family nutrient uptake outer membrane protein [Pedobacter sp.]